MALVRLKRAAMAARATFGLRHQTVLSLVRAVALAVLQAEARRQMAAIMAALAEG